MVRSRVLLSAIFATLGVALAGCAAPLSPGYYAGGYPYESTLPLRRVAGMAGGIVCRCRST